MIKRVLQALAITAIQSIAFVVFCFFAHEHIFKFRDSIANILLLPSGLIGFAPLGWRQTHLQPFADAFGGIPILINMMIVFNAFCWFGLLSLPPYRLSERSTSNH